MSQSPSAETTKKSDFVIDVTISKGVQSAELVSLVDYERTAAKLVLEKMNLGLDIQYEEKHSNSVPAGTVIATEPQAGTMLSVGDTVVVTVSLGPEIKPVTVISFLDMTKEQAEEAARKLGLVPTFREVEIDGVAGLVIGQSIEPSTQVNEGAVIELRISRETRYDPEGVMPIEPEEPDIFGSGTAG